MTNIKKWDLVRINNNNDLYFDVEMRPFIGEQAIVQQITKGGLFICETRDGKRAKIKKKNLDLIKSYDPADNLFPTFVLDKKAS